MRRESPAGEAVRDHHQGHGLTISSLPEFGLGGLLTKALGLFRSAFLQATPAWLLVFGWPLSLTKHALQFWHASHELTAAALHGMHCCMRAHACTHAAHALIIGSLDKHPFECYLFVYVPGGYGAVRSNTPGDVC